MTKTEGQGVAGVVLCLFCYNAAEAHVKWLASAYPILEITFFRNLFTFLPILIVAYQSGGLTSLRSSRLGLNVARGAVGAVAMLLYHYSVAVMPLANVAAISLLWPMLVVILSGPLIGERPTVVQISATAVALLGALIIVWPQTSALGMQAVLPLAAVVCTAFYILLLRFLSSKETSAALMLYPTLLGALGTGATLPWNWVTPGLADMAVLLSLGVFAGVALYLRNFAYRLIPTTLAAPFEYTIMLWTTLIGWVVFSDVPTPQTILGAMLLLAANVFLLHLHRAPKPTGQAA